MKVIIIRGTSGSGKTTYAKNLVSNFLREKPGGTFSIVSADDYFMRDGNYEFNPAELGEAHRQCFGNFMNALNNCVDLVIVDNTNINKYEIAPYLMFASCRRSDYREVEIIRCVATITVAAERNVHGVSLKTIDSMATRMEKLLPFWPTEVVVDS
jgi:tRNA uridine 5-carbamoylmethylation protein Kti12